MIELNLQWFGGGKSGSGAGGGGTGHGKSGSKSVSKQSFTNSVGSSHAKAGTNNFTEPRVQERQAPASLYPQQPPQAVPREPNSSRSSGSSSSKGGSYVHSVNPRENYKVYSVRDRKEQYIGESKGSDIMSGLQYDSHNNVWRDKRNSNMKYKVRRSK